MNYLSKSQILILHESLIKNFGGISGIRDENSFDSAISAPFQTFGGKDLYNSIIEKAARLGYGIIKNHPFIDGNKRTGTHTMLIFLSINGIKISYRDEDLIKIIFQIAEGTAEYNDLLHWLNEHLN